MNLRSSERIGDHLDSRRQEAEEKLIDYRRKWWPDYPDALLMSGFGSALIAKFRQQARIEQRDIEIAWLMLSDQLLQISAGSGKRIAVAERIPPGFSLKARRDRQTRTDLYASYGLPASTPDFVITESTTTRQEIGSYARCAMTTAWTDSYYCTFMTEINLLRIALELELGFVHERESDWLPLRIDHLSPIRLSLIQLCSAADCVETRIKLFGSALYDDLELDPLYKSHLALHEGLAIAAPDLVQQTLLERTPQTESETMLLYLPYLKAAQEKTLDATQYLPEEIAYPIRLSSKALEMWISVSPPSHYAAVLREAFGTPGLRLDCASVVCDDGHLRGPDRVRSLLLAPTGGHLSGAALELARLMVPDSAVCLTLLDALSYQASLDPVSDRRDYPKSPTNNKLLIDSLAKGGVSQLRYDVGSMNWLCTRRREEIDAGLDERHVFLNQERELAEKVIPLFSTVSAYHFAETLRMLLLAGLRGAESGIPYSYWEA